MSAQRCGYWHVVTTPITYVEPVLEDGSGPLEHGSAVLFVYAYEARRAGVLAVRAWRRQDRLRRLRRDTRPDFLDDPDRSPYGAVTVRRTSPAEEWLIRTREQEDDERTGQGAATITGTDEPCA